MLGASFVCAKGVLAADCASGPVANSVVKSSWASGMSERFAALPTTAPTFIIGDSIAYRWPSDLLEEAFAKPGVDKLAVGGARIENISFLLEQMPVSRAEQVVVVLGTNNVREDDECAFQSKLDFLLTLVRKKAPNASVYMVNLLPKGFFTRAFAAKIASLNLVYSALANQPGVKLVNVHDPMYSRCEGIESCPLLEDDRLHPNKAGYRFLTDILRSCVAAVSKRGECDANRGH